MLFSIAVAVLSLAVVFAVPVVSVIAIPETKSYVCKLCRVAVGGITASSFGIALTHASYVVCRIYDIPPPLRGEVLLQVVVLVLLVNVLALAAIVAYIQFPNYTRTLESGL